MKSVKLKSLERLARPGPYSLPRHEHLDRIFFFPQKILASIPKGEHDKRDLWNSFKIHADLRDTDILMLFNVKEKKNLIWISFLLEVDVYFQNIALATSAEAIYCPQRGS